MMNFQNILHAVHPLWCVSQQVTCSVFYTGKQKNFKHYYAIKIQIFDSFDMFIFEWQIMHWTVFRGTLVMNLNFMNSTGRFC